MDIISNLNERLRVIDRRNEVVEEYIKKIVERSPIKLPDDYIDFLKEISCDDISVSFEIDGVKEFVIWSAKFGYECVTLEYDDPVYEKFVSCTWLIGDDLGGDRYFYGEGKEGFGIYKVDAGAMDPDNAEKIADSLTDLLVNGVGLGIIFEE